MLATDYAPAFDVSSDYGLGIVTFELRGSFDEFALAGLADARTQAIREMLRRCRRYSSLVDLSRCELVGKDLVAGFERMFAGPGKPADRMAIVVERALVRMQVRRMTATRRNARFFENRSAALSWLAGDSQDEP